jgi:uncharacterized protein YbjT (DUF2867 family)
MSRILVFGGHGKVALLLAPLLVERGHLVTSVIRNPAHAAEVEATGATARVADVERLDTAQLAELTSGHDAAIRSMDAAAAAGATRYVMVSYFGAGPDHGVPEGDSFYAYAEAKSAADEHLRASALEYTILAPGALTLDAATGRIDVAATESASVARADVAAVVAAALAEPATIGRSIRFNSGTVPIPEALRG